MLNDSGTYGVMANYGSSVIRISNNTITNNNRGLGIGSQSGSIVSFGNNRIIGNTAADGDPTSTAAMK